MYNRFFGGGGGGHAGGNKQREQEKEQQPAPAPRRVPSAGELAASLFEANAFYNLGRVLQEQQQQQQAPPQRDYDFHHYHRGRPMSESAPMPPSRLRHRGGGGGGHGDDDDDDETSDSLLLCNIRPQDVPRAGQHPYYQEADYLHPHEAAGGGHGAAAAAGAAGGRPFRSMCDALLPHGRIAGDAHASGVMEASGGSGGGGGSSGGGNFFQRLPAASGGEARAPSLGDSVDSTSFVVSGFGTISPSFGAGGGYSSVSSTSSADSQMEKGAAVSGSSAAAAAAAAASASTTSAGGHRRLHISPSSDDLGASFQGPPNPTYGISEILAGAEAHDLPLPLPSPTTAASASPFQYFFGRKLSQASLASGSATSTTAAAAEAAERRGDAEGMSTVWEVAGGRGSGGGVISLEHLQLLARCVREAAEAAMEALLGPGDDKAETAGDKTRLLSPSSSSSSSSPSTASSSSSSSSSSSLLSASPEEHRCFLLGLFLGCLACALLLLLTGAGAGLAPSAVFGGKARFPYYYPYAGDRGALGGAGGGGFADGGHNSAAHHLPFMSLPATPGAANGETELPQAPSAQGLSLFGTRKTQQIISKQVLTSKEGSTAGAGGGGGAGAGEPLATGSGGFWAAVAEFLGTQQQGTSDAPAADSGGRRGGSQGRRRTMSLLPSLTLGLPRLRLPDAAEVVTTMAAASTGLWQAVTQTLCNLLLSLLRKLPFVPSDLGKRHWHQQQQQQDEADAATTASASA